MTPKSATKKSTVKKDKLYMVSFHMILRGRHRLQAPDHKQAEAAVKAFLKRHITEIREKLDDVEALDGFDLMVHAYPTPLTENEDPRLQKS